MNIIGNGSNMSGGGLPPQLMQQIRKVKGIMQMCKGQIPKTVFENLCKQNGIDGNAIINELKR